VTTGRAQPRIGERTMAALAKHAIYPRRDWLSRSQTRGHFPTSKTLDLTLFFARRALVIGRVRRASCFPIASLVDFHGKRVLKKPFICNGLCGIIEPDLVL